MFVSRVEFILLSMTNCRYGSQFAWVHFRINFACMHDAFSSIIYLQVIMIKSHKTFNTSSSHHFVINSTKNIKQLRMLSIQR